ncbi:Kinetochore-associated protein MTW1 [Escovopsis weberi]|uniref:Kinetochore-associated protein MTW1 n=1 Tax=Escovopsis weberi TaxID=150374 RepID=A0A0N0RSS2_ESCWE|nr:Kinetochore-associated protein MTW1 [Escovopsis weberi]
MTAAPSDYELLTEHFSYPPVSLLDDIINTVNTLADRALESVERLLLSIPPQKLGFSAKKSKGKNAPANPDLPPDEAAHLEIENGTHQLETLLNASIDKTFDVFELYVMQNILNVRPQDQPFMRLSHYAGLDLQQLDAPDRPTPESITGLRRRLQASQRLNAVLEAEKARNDALLASLRGLLGAVHPADADANSNANADANENRLSTGGQGVTSEGEATTGAPFAFLRDRAGLEEGGGAQPITTTTEFTLSQLQALRSLSTSLRTLLPDLTAAVAADANADAGAKAEAQGPKSWRRERAEYIESSSRKYLETVSGLELSAAGEVRDGDWQGQGRALSKADVEGLEKIVALLEDNDGNGTPSPGAGDAMNQD